MFERLVDPIVRGWWLGASGRGDRVDEGVDAGDAIVSGCHRRWGCSRGRYGQCPLFDIGQVVALNYRLIRLMCKRKGRGRAKSWGPLEAYS